MYKVAISEKKKKNNLSSEFIFERENAMEEHYRSVESVYTHTHMLVEPFSYMCKVTGVSKTALNSSFISS